MIFIYAILKLVTVTEQKGGKCFMKYGLSNKIIIMIMVIVILFSKSTVYANSAYPYMPIQTVPIWYPIVRDRDYSEQNYKDKYDSKNSSTIDLIDHIFLIFVIIILINSLSICIFMILRDVKNYFKKGR